MIGTEDGYWFSYLDRSSPVQYSFRRYGEELEVGEAATVDDVTSRFEVFLAKQRGQIH